MLLQCTDSGFQGPMESQEALRPSWLEAFSIHIDPIKRYPCTQLHSLGGKIAVLNVHFCVVPRELKQEPNTHHEDDMLFALEFHPTAMFAYNVLCKQPALSLSILCWKEIRRSCPIASWNLPSFYSPSSKGSFSLHSSHKNPYSGKV